MALPFFGIGMKTDLFQSCDHCWVFQICWHIECSTFTTSSFRIWNSSTGIPSHPLALFVVMLPKAHLTLHFRMSGSRWVVALSWLSGSWSSFWYSSPMYSCYLFLISSASVRSIPFLSFIVPIFAWNCCILLSGNLENKLVKYECGKRCLENICWWETENGKCRYWWCGEAWGVLSWVMNGCSCSL